MNKANAVKAYNDMCDMCDKNMIPKKLDDEAVFIAGYMSGYLAAVDAQITRIGELLGDKS